MLGSFFGRMRASNAGVGGWPTDKVVASLKRHYGQVSQLGEEEGFAIYGVADRGVNFVVALIVLEGARDRVAEIAFLARFVGFKVKDAMVEAINRNLHLSVVGLEESGDLFLLAGIEAAGAFDEATFSLVLEAWRRDLTMVLHTLSGRASIAASFPAANSAAARRFATNRAPGGDGAAPDILAAYLSANLGKALCGECGGRGKRGLIARECENCDGSGFVKKRG